MTLPDISVTPSEWGFTATLANGVVIAHSQSKELLDEYLATCFSGGDDVSVPKGTRGVHAGSGDGNVGTRNVPAPKPSGTAPPTAVSAGVPTALTKVSYSTRARTTGAKVSTGRAVEGGWATLCVSHGSLTSATNGKDAESNIKIIGEWCAGCAPIVAGTEPKIKKDALLEDLL